MSDTDLQKKIPEVVREKTQYALAFGVIATMLFAVGFPMFIIVFFAIFAFFLWKTFAAPSSNGTREIFEFYLSANEILRDDERRWFGFEIQNVVKRGERIVQLMNGAPPLVYFTLGALYNRAGDHKSAVNHLSYIVENEKSDEKTYLYATPELKSYVRILRKIEREPAEAPQTSAAIRALERARRNRGKIILAESRAAAAESANQPQTLPVEQLNPSSTTTYIQQPLSVTAIDKKESVTSKEEFIRQTVKTSSVRNSGNSQKKKNSSDESFAPRRPISEVLHDIYDK